MRAVTPRRRRGRAAGQPLRLHRRARARHRVQRDRDDGRRRARCGWSGAAPCPSRRWSTCRSATSPTSFAAVGADRTTATQTLDQYSVPSTGLGARFELRPRHRRRRAPGRRRLARDRGADPGAVPVRRRRADRAAASPAAAPARSAPSPKLGWERGDFTLSAGGRLDRWWIARRQRCASACSPPARRSPTRVFPTAAAGKRPGAPAPAWRPAEPLTPARRRLSRLAAADPERALPPVPGRRRRDRRQCRARARAARRRRGRPRMPAGGRGADRRHPVRQPARGRDLQRHPRPGAGRLSRRRLRRRRRPVPPAPECRGDRQPRRRARRRADASGAGGSAPATASPTPRSAPRGTALPLDGLRPAQAPRHSAAATLAWEGRRGALASLTARYVGNQYEDDLNRQLHPRRAAPSTRSACCR